MPLIDDLRTQNPRLSAVSDEQLIGALAQQPEYQGLSDNEMQALAYGGDKPQASDPGFTSGLVAGVDQTQAMFGGLMMAAGEKAGSEDLYGAGKELYQRNMDEAQENALGYGFTDLFSNPETSALQWTSYTAGNLLPTMATAVAGGGIGGMMARSVAGAVAKRAATQAGQMIGTYAASAGMETGSIMGEVDNADVALAHGSIAGALDALPVIRALRKFGGKQLADRATNEVADGALASLKRTAGRSLKGATGKGALTQAMIESTTEGLQTLIEQHAKYWVENNGESLLNDLGEANWKHIIDASAAGALGGTMMGAPAGIAERGQARRAVNNLPADQQSEGGRSALPPTQQGPDANPDPTVYRNANYSDADVDRAWAYYDLPPAQRARRRKEQAISAAQQQAAEGGGDALQQASAGLKAEQMADTVNGQESAASVNQQASEIGNRIQIAMNGADDMASIAGETEQGKTRLRNLNSVLQRAESAYADSNIELANRLTGRAEMIGNNLARSLNRPGSRERPATGRVEGAAPFGGLLGQDSAARLNAPDPSVINMGGPTADQTQYDPQARNVRRDERMAAQQQGEARLREQATGPAQIADQNIVYGQGEVAQRGNANTGMDQQARDPRFTDTRAQQADDPQRAQQQRQAQQTAELSRTRGPIETAYLPDNTPVKTRYRVMDLAELTPSNAEDGRINPAYPQELQPRDRTNTNSQVQVRNIAANLNPERLGPSSDAATGAPIVGADGVVESGNGRTMAIGQAYRQGRGSSYRQYVNQQAQAMGMDPSAIGEMQQPVLVRERITNIDRGDFSRRANESTVAGMTAYEQARADAAALTDGDIQQWSPGQSGDPLAASNRAFQRTFVARLGNNEAARYTARDGQASPELGQRMQRAVFAKAYADNDMVEMATEQGEAMRNLTAGLQAAAADLAVARATGSEDALTAIGTINDAVRLTRRARQDGTPIRELVSQQDVFSEPVPTLTADLALALNANMRSRKALAEAMGYIGQAVRQRAEGERNGTLFDDTTTNRDVIDEGFRQANTQQRATEGDVSGRARQGESQPAQGRQADPTQGNAAEALDEPLLQTYTEQASQQAQQDEAATRYSLKAKENGENVVVNLSDIRFSKASPTSSAAFKRWFGDSPNVDAEGNPAIFYHGGSADFSSIDDGRFGSGIFAREGAPSGYGEVQHALYIRSPILELAEMEQEIGSNAGRQIVKDEARITDEDTLDLVIASLSSNEHYPDSPEVWDAIGAIDEADAALEIQSLRGRVAKKLGYDAVRQPDEFDGETVMVLDSSAIKSADNNTGTYDPANPDIRYSFAGARPSNRAQQGAEQPTTAEAVRNAMAGMERHLGDVTIIESARDLPEQALSGMALNGVDPREVRGLYQGDTLYVIAANNDSVEEAVRTAVHEAVGHKGIRGVLGETIEPVMRQLYKTLPLSKQGREALNEVLESYTHLDRNNPDDQITIAEEMVAHLLEKGYRPKAWQRAMASIRAALRQLVPWVKWSYADVLALGDQAREHLAYRQAKADQGAAFDAQRYSIRSRRPHNAGDSFSDLTDADRELFTFFGDHGPARTVMDWYHQQTQRVMLKIRQGLVDQVGALRELDQKRFGEDAFTQNAVNSSWMLARLSKSAASAVQAMMTNGRVYLDPQEKIIKMRDGESKGLAEVLRRLGSSDEITRFLVWIAANRSSKLNDEGREFMLNEEQIQRGVRFNEGSMNDGRNRNAVYSEVFTEFQQYRDDVLSIAEQAGTITREQRQMWRDEFYVPFYRLSEDKAVNGMAATSGLSRQQAYTRLKGGTQNVSDLLQNTMMNFNHLVDSSLKNQAASQAVQNAQAMGMARAVAETGRDPKTSTFVMEDGKKVFYEIDDPMVFSAITALGHAGMNSTMMKVMRAFKRVFTNLTTTTPQFMMANLIRDSLQAVATNEVSKNAFSNVAGGYRSYKDEKTRAAMLASGASFSFGHIYGNNPDELRAQLTRNMRDATIVGGPAGEGGFARQSWNLVNAGWRWYNSKIDETENINRAAIFTQNRERLAADYAAGKRDDAGDLQAAFEARDLIDFSANGAWPFIRILIDIVPFMNARLQGLDKIYRSGVKPGTNVLKAAMTNGDSTVSDRQAAARFFSVTGALTMATIALYLHNKDDEEYKKLEDWQKDTYWFVRFGDQKFFIPKPFEVGAIATLAERVTQQFVDDEATGKVFRQRMMQMMGDTFSFSPVPQMMQPALDIYANYDAFTRRPIESMGMDRLSPELRKRASTSKLATWTSEALNSTVGAIGGPDTNPLALSPVQIDHLVGGYLGQIGTWVVGLGDVGWSVATGKESPARRWYEYQPIRRFYKNMGDEDRYTRYGTVFYEGLREAQRAHSDVKELNEMGRLADARELATTKSDMLRLRTRLNRAQSRMGKLNKRIDQIRRADLDGSLKRQRIDRIRAIKNQIQRALADQVIEAKASG